MRPISHAHIARPEDHRTGWWCTVTLVVMATLVGCNQTEDSSGSSDPDGGNDDATTGSDADLCGDGLVEGVEGAGVAPPVGGLEPPVQETFEKLFLLEPLLDL